MENRPLGPYAILVSTYLTLFSIIAGLLRRRRLLDETPPARDLAMLGLATFRLSRLITYDRVTSIFRQPFVEQGEGYEQIEGTQEEPEGEGLQLAIGQLLNCSWCMSIWAGTFNAGLYTLWPRIGRFFLMTLMASGISELLDPVFPLLNYLAGYIEKKEEALERRWSEVNNQ